MSEVATLEAPAAAAGTQDANQAPDTQATAAQAVGTPSPNAGTDGEQASSEATLQTAEKPTEGLEKAPDQRSEEEIRRDERQRYEREQREEANREAERQKAAEQATKQREAADKLRAMRREFPKTLRSHLNRIAADADIVIDPTVREEIEDLIEDYNLKALDAAKLELGDLGTALKLETEDLWMANVRSSLAPGKTADFDKEIEAAGYTYASIVKAAQKYAPQAPGTVHVSDLVEKAQAYGSDAANNLNAAEQRALTDSLKGAKTAEAVIDALGKALRARGSRDPGQGVGGNERGSSGGPSSLAEAEQMHAGMHPSGLKITNDQMRTYMATGHI